MFRIFARRDIQLLTAMAAALPITAAIKYCSSVIIESDAAADAMRRGRSSIVFAELKLPGALH